MSLCLICYVKPVQCTLYSVLCLHLICLTYSRLCIPFLSEFFTCLVFTLKPALSIAFTCLICTVYCDICLNCPYYYPQNFLRWYCICLTCSCLSCTCLVSVHREAVSPAPASSVPAYLVAVSPAPASYLTIGKLSLLHLTRLYLPIW
jgi:hypothetical protein